MGNFMSKIFGTSKSKNKKNKDETLETKPLLNSEEDDSHEIVIKIQSPP